MIVSFRQQICKLCKTRLTVASHAKLILHENVKNFPQSILSESLPEHKLYAFKICTADVGYGLMIKRDRMYRFLVHKDVCLLADPLEVYGHVKKALRSSVSVSQAQDWQNVHGLSLLISNMLAQVCNSKALHLLRKRCKCTETCTCTFLSQLTWHQTRRLREYKSILRKKRKKFLEYYVHLGDNPKHRRRTNICLL